jgi:multiple sugar transport system substrate-binding protein
MEVRSMNWGRLLIAPAMRLGVAIPLAILLAVAPLPPTANTAQDVQLGVICLCVHGGVNNNLVLWMRQTVIPRFEQAARAAGTPAHVTLVEFGASDEALKQRYALDLRSGRGPDLLYFDQFWVPEFASGGLIRPLRDIVGPDLDRWEGWSHLRPSLRALFEYRGGLYGIPVGTDVRAIYYRKDLFRKAGLPDNWQPRSWAELLRAARQIKQRVPGVVPLQLNAGTAMGEATTLQGWFMVLLGAGSNVYDFRVNKWIVRSPAMLDALRFYRTVYVSQQLGDARLQLLPGGRDRSFEGFRDGRIAMLVEGDFFWRSVLAPGTGSVAMPKRNQLVGWAKMPAQMPAKGLHGRDWVTASGGFGMIINPHTQHPALAWKLVTTFFDRDAMLEFQKIEPRVRPRADVPVTGDPVMSEMARQLLPITTVRPARPEYPRVSVEIQRMTERVVSGEMTPERAMDEYARAVKAIVGAGNTVDLLGR